MFNVSKLRGRIVEVFGTVGAFAEAAGSSRVYVSMYLNHKTVLNQETIIKWANLLGIAEEEIPAYFFTLEVDETQHEEALV